jgi:hypothetical protein
MPYRKGNVVRLKRRVWCRCVWCSFVIVQHTARSVAHSIIVTRADDLLCLQLHTVQYCNSC